MPAFVIGSLGVTGSTLAGALILDFATQWVRCCLLLPASYTQFSRYISSCFRCCHILLGECNHLTLVQIGWALAVTLQTEKFYDAFGSIGFTTVTLATLTYTHYYYARQCIVSVFVCLWAIRLGSFLLYRVLKTGKDSRFDEVKTQPGQCLTMCGLHGHLMSSLRHSLT